MSQHQQRPETDLRPVDGPEAPGPHARLRDLDVLVGTWRLEGQDLASGETFTGTVIREWLDGGYVLVQRTETGSHAQVGAEYIGYDSAAGSLRSMLFSDEGPGPFCPFALEYFGDVDGAALTIWHGFKDSPAKFVGTSRLQPAAGPVASMAGTS